MSIEIYTSKINSTVTISITITYDRQPTTNDQQPSVDESFVLKQPTLLLPPPSPPMLLAASSSSPFLVGGMQALACGKCLFIFVKVKNVGQTIFCSFMRSMEATANSTCRLTCQQCWLKYLKVCFCMRLFVLKNVYKYFMPAPVFERLLVYVCGGSVCMCICMYVYFQTTGWYVSLVLHLFMCGKSLWMHFGAHKHTDIYLCAGICTYVLFCIH